MSVRYLIARLRLSSFMNPADDVHNRRVATVTLLPAGIVLVSKWNVGTSII